MSYSSGFPLGLLCWHRVYQIWMTTMMNTTRIVPDSKVHGAYMVPTWGRQDPGGPLLAPWALLSGVFILWRRNREKKNLMGVGDDDIMWIPKELLIHPNKTKKTVCMFHGLYYIYYTDYPQHNPRQLIVLPRLKITRVPRGAWDYLKWMTAQLEIANLDHY